MHYSYETFIITNIIKMKLLQNAICTTSRTIFNIYPNFMPRTRLKIHQQVFGTVNSMRYATASIFGFPKVTDWSKAVSDAERIVGYPTSFMSLRCLLSDELSNLALQMRKLVGTKHPLLKTARRFIYDGKHNLQTRGLLVLLISKAAGPSSTHNDMEHMVAGIYPSQRTLAEITEMIHTGYLVHKGVVNLASIKPSDGPYHDMQFGNKMAVLSGDFLLANASLALAELYNTYVVEVMSTAIRDLMAAEFTRFCEVMANVTLLDDKITLEDWEQQTYLSSGSLVAKGCEAAMILANHNANVMKMANEFGKQLGYINQIREDMEPLESVDDEVIKVTSVPVILHMSHNGNQDELIFLLSNPIQNHKKIVQLLKSSGAIEETKSVCHHYGKEALKCLDVFEPSEANAALQNIVYAATKLN